MTVQHDVSISGGKESQAVACLSVERAQSKGFGNLPPRYFFCDTGNEHPITIEQVAYVSDWLYREVGQRVTTLTAYDVPGLIDAAAFERKRRVIREEWPFERRRTRHSKACTRKRDKIPALAPGCRHSPERTAALKAWAAECQCPLEISPPVPQELIEAAVAALQPTGIAFLDMAMLHGRFPGTRTRFCTDELKLQPLMAVKRPLLDEGVSIVSWIGERADESKARAEKPWLERQRHEHASEFLYRPVLNYTALDVLALRERHGLRHNPLYRMGMTRVGCMPCIMAKKGELREIAERFPEVIDRLEEWERIAGAVARRVIAGGAITTFFPAPSVPGDKDDHTRAAIRKAVEWSRTSRGGRQLDLLEFAGRGTDPHQCSSSYGLCE